MHMDSLTPGTDISRRADRAGEDRQAEIVFWVFGKSSG